MPFEPINPPQFPTPIAPYRRWHQGGRHRLRLGHAGTGGRGDGLHRATPGADRAVLETSGHTWRRRRTGRRLLHHISCRTGGPSGRTRFYAEYFGCEPARYCIQCGLVKPGLLVEIASVAYLGHT